MQTDLSVQVKEIDTAWHETFRNRNTFNQVLQDGIITEETFALSTGEIDLALSESEINWGSLIPNSNRAAKSALMITIIQENNAENVINRLAKFGITIKRLPNTGGLLRKKNETLQIEIPEHYEIPDIQILHKFRNSRENLISSGMDKIPIDIFVVTSFP